MQWNADVIFGFYIVPLYLQWEKQFWTVWEKENRRPTSNKTETDDIYEVPWNVVWIFEVLLQLSRMTERLIECEKKKTGPWRQ